MRDFAPKFRYALKWLFGGVVCLGLIAAVFAAVLPFLVKDRAVRDALVRSLSAWSGGPVAIKGRLRIGSFSSLTIEARDVSFTATPRLSPVDRIEAKSVTAVLDLQSLLRGQVEFARVTADEPRIVLSRQGAFSKPDFSGLEAADAVIAFASLSHFSRLDLRNCTFFAAEGEHRAYSRFSAKTIGIARDPDGSNFALRLKNQGLDATFRGNLSHAAGTANGKVRLTVPAEHPAAARIVAAMAPWEKGNGVSIDGELTWLPGRLSLDEAAIGFGRHTAKGSLAFAAQQGRRLAEGTLAYDTLEWVPVPGDPDGSGSASKSLRTLIAASSDGNTDFDMRISAEHFRAGSHEAGPLALALAARAGRVSIDVAELAIFGGKIAGKLDYDAGRPAVLTVTANGTQLDSEALAAAAVWPVAIAGPVTFHTALEVPFGEQPLLQELKTATGSFGIAFPAGGTLDGEVSKRLSEAFANKEIPWGWSSSSIPFTTASLDGTVKPGQAALKLDADAADSRVAGALRIVLPGGQISGTLTVEPAAPIEGALPAPVGVSASIGLSGTAETPSFSALSKASLQN
jgi:hypothetical protein